MKKPDFNHVISGWVVIEPQTRSFLSGIHGICYGTSEDVDNVYLFETRKAAVEAAKHLGKGRTTIVARMSVAYNISFRGATEVVGEDAKKA